MERRFSVNDQKKFSQLLVMLSHVVCPQRVCVCVHMNIASSGPGVRLVLTYVYSSISLQRELLNGPQGWLLLAEGAVTPHPHRITSLSVCDSCNQLCASNSLWYARTTFGAILSQAKS